MTPLRARRAHRAIVASLTSLLLAPPAALAHDGHLVHPVTLWRSWNWDPGIILWLGLITVVYTRGLRAVWSRVGPGRGIRSWQALAFAGGVLALAVSLITPLDALSHALFSAHMGQHTLLIAVAAPLLALSAPFAAIVWGLPISWRRATTTFRTAKRRTIWWRALAGFWRFLIRPPVALVLHVISVWIWHLPNLYEAALHNSLLHGLEHAFFLGTGTLFWWSLLVAGIRYRAGYALGILYIFFASVQSNVLGALITFAPFSWYPTYATTTAAWGLTPLEDQQLAGAIMWVPAGMTYVIAALSMVAAWLHSDARAARARDFRASAASPSPAAQRIPRPPHLPRSVPLQP